MPSRAASAGPCIATGAPSMRDLARVRTMNPGQDLHQRRLAGAVLARRAPTISPAATSKSTRSSATTPGNRLEIADICSKGTGSMVTPARPAWEQRWHPLREEWVVVAAHRQDRPWQGERAVGLATAGARIRRELLFLSRQRARERRAQSRLPVGVRLRQRSSVRRRRCARGSSSAPPGIYRNAPATGVARVVCYTPKHNTTLAELPVARYRRPARTPGAISISSSARGPSPPRADLREQGRGGRRVEPASARSDLRDELRVQDHRDRSRGQPALLRGARPRRSFRTSSAPEQEDGRRILFENSSAIAFLPYFARYAYECYVAPKETHASLATMSAGELRRAGRRRSSRCWSATTTCGRCRSRTC